MEGRYPIRAVAKITGLGLDTIRAWERRYHAVLPERSERGRAYAPDQIQRLLRLSQLTRRGHAIGRIASLSDGELDVLLMHPSASSQQAQSLPNLLDSVLSAIDSFDPRGASDELSRLAALLSPRDLVYQVAAPLMRETGARWHSGRFSIAQEHLVSQILRNLLGSMMRLFRPADSPVKMVFATPAGESHDFGILASAMLASAAGMDTVYLGPDLPATEIVVAAERTRARVIAIGVTAVLPNSASEIKALAASLPAHTELWVGGESTFQMDFSGATGGLILLRDLPAFESECLRVRNINYENCS